MHRDENTVSAEENEPKFYGTDSCSNALFQTGDTALHVACREGLLSVAQSLCAFGCAVDVANGEGQFPLHLAAKAGHTEVKVA